MPGVSDLLYYESWDRGLIAIEMKYPGERHEVSRLISQASWIIDVCKCAGFVDDLGMFKNIIKGDNCWIDPVKVLHYCQSVKSKTIEWDRNLFV